MENGLDWNMDFRAVWLYLLPGRYHRRYGFNAAAIVGFVLGIDDVLSPVDGDGLYLHDHVSRRGFANRQFY